MSVSGFPCAHCIEEYLHVQTLSTQGSLRPKAHMAIPAGCSQSEPQATELTCNAPFTLRTNTAEDMGAGEVFGF